jgi:hypothetical protein
MLKDVELVQIKLGNARLEKAEKAADHIRPDPAGLWQAFKRCLETLSPGAGYPYP